MIQDELFADDDNVGGEVLTELELLGLYMLGEIKWPLDGPEPTVGDVLGACRD